MAVVEYLYSSTSTGTFWYLNTRLVLKLKVLGLGLGLDLYMDDLYLPKSQVVYSVQTCRLNSYRIQTDTEFRSKFFIGGRVQAKSFIKGMQSSSWYT